MRARQMPILVLLLVGYANGAVIQRSTGLNQTELTHMSVAGGTHLLITGTDLERVVFTPYYDPHNALVLLHNAL